MSKTVTARRWVFYDVAVTALDIHRGGVPYALDAQGNVADPKTAARKTLYTCLGCGARVNLRRGLKRKPHFSHHKGKDCGATAESIEHLAFKKALTRRLMAAQKFTAMLECPACRCRTSVTYPLASGSSVREEVWVGPYRADVAVCRDEQVTVAFEVYVTHAVDPQKAAALSVPWFEVSARTALLLDPHQPPKVQVLDTNIFSFRPCKQCGNRAGSAAQAAHTELLAREQRFREEALQMAREREERERREREQVREAEQRILAEAQRREQQLKKRQESMRQAAEERAAQQAEWQAAQERQRAAELERERVSLRWVTAFTDQLANHRAPVYAIVCGVRVLFHVHLFPEVALCQTSTGQYALKDNALRLYRDGREHYASGQLGEVFTRLLSGEYQPLPAALPLLEDLRRAVAESRALGTPPEPPASAPATDSEKPDSTQPRLL